MGLSPDVIAAAYRSACLAELDALKPGNVHRFASGHGMEAADFEASAEASAPFLAGPGTTVGARVLGAVQATMTAVRTNTNLGILLLAAPLAAAAETMPAAAGRGAAAALRSAVGQVLAGLDARDAEDVFRAIALASPGGLGHRSEHDVRRPPTIGLMQAMRIAAGTDRIAVQYAEDFADVFALGLPVLREAEAAGLDDASATVDCFLAFAAAFPDSHVLRKFGPGQAEDVRRSMEALRNRFKAIADPEAQQVELLAADTALKSRRLNPGTSADLTVASIFAKALLGKLEDCGLR